MVMIIGPLVAFGFLQANNIIRLLIAATDYENDATGWHRSFTNRGRSRDDFEAFAR